MDNPKTLDYQGYSFEYYQKIVCKNCNHDNLTIISMDYSEESVTFNCNKCLQDSKFYGTFYNVPDSHRREQENVKRMFNEFLQKLQDNGYRLSVDYDEIHFYKLSGEMVVKI